MNVATTIEPRSRPGTPVWEIAHLFPEQGRWSESAYLALDTNHLVEFKDGCLEVLPMPTAVHQALVKFLAWLLDEHVRSHHLGEVFFAPLRMHTVSHTIREPDVMFVAKQRSFDRTAPVPGADLVMEVVSEGRENRERDLVEKRTEYAQAGIHEYWIVDPEERMITVLALEGETYRAHGEFREGETATSALLPGFEVDVTKCFAAGDGPNAANRDH